MCGRVGMRRCTFFVKVSTTSFTNFAAARLSLRGTWHSSLAVDPCRWRRALDLGGLGLSGSSPGNIQLNQTCCQNGVLQSISKV